VLYLFNYLVLSDSNEEVINPPIARSTSIEKTLPIKKVQLSTMFSLQLISEKHNLEMQKNSIAKDQVIS